MNVHGTQQGAILQSSDRGGIRIQFSKNPFGRKRDAAGNYVTEPEQPGAAGGGGDGMAGGGMAAGEGRAGRAFGSAVSSQVHGWEGVRLAAA